MIINGEARHLQALEKWPMKWRKRMLAEVADASGTAIDAMKANLREAHAQAPRAALAPQRSVGIFGRQEIAGARPDTDQLVDSFSFGGLKTVRVPTAASATKKRP